MPIECFDLTTHCLFPVVEGVYLHQRSQSPYEGDVFHETPTGLLFYTYLLKLNCNVLQAVFILCDVITAIVLTKATRLFIQDIVSTILVSKLLFFIKAEINYR